MRVECGGAAVIRSFVFKLKGGEIKSYGDGGSPYVERAAAHTGNNSCQFAPFSTVLSVVE